MRVGLFIPTFNAGDGFIEVVELINEQSEMLYRKLIIDSGSIDNTVNIALDNNFEVKEIPLSEFGHGKTRTLAAKELSDCQYVIYMSHDVFLQKDAIKNIIHFITTNSNIGIVYGKQDVDMKKSNIFEKRAREFNYPDESSIKSYANKKQYGIKTVFSSDAFAIYDQEKLKKIGYFPKNINFAEDIFVAAKMIQEGYNVGYCAEAKVFHSHNYSALDEYKRYKEIGKFHRENSWIQDEFGKNEKEGIKAVTSELRILIKSGKYHLLPNSMSRFLLKYLGYRKGNSSKLIE